MAIDWAKFDGFSEGMVDCRCGVQFKGHASVDYGDVDRPILVSQHPCPSCGRTRFHRAIRSGPEEMTIGSEDVRKIS